MAADTLNDAFLDALRDVYGAERQTIKILPKLIAAATAPDLRALLKAHLEETKEQIDRLEQVFASLKKKKKTHKCRGMAGILEEARAVAKAHVDARTMDAWLIASVQRVEHYEMAVYGTLVAWGQVLGHARIVAFLAQTLEQERAADRRLSKLAARGGANKRAVAAARLKQTDEV